MKWAKYLKRADKARALVTEDIIARLKPLSDEQLKQLLYIAMSGNNTDVLISAIIAEQFSRITKRTT